MHFFNNNISISYNKAADYNINNNSFELENILENNTFLNNLDIG